MNNFEFYFGMFKSLCLMVVQDLWYAIWFPLSSMYCSTFVLSWCMYAKGCSSARIDVSPGVDCSLSAFIPIEWKKIKSRGRNALALNDKKKLRKERAQIQTKDWIGRNGMGLKYQGSNTHIQWIRIYWVYFFCACKKLIPIYWIENDNYQHP